jgi:hypothetical protein
MTKIKMIGIKFIRGLTCADCTGILHSLLYGDLFDVLEYGFDAG